MPEQEQELANTEDLARVYIRAQDTEGKWSSINAQTASDHQFHEWAKSRCPLDDTDSDEWPSEERLSFCRFLYGNGALHLITREAFEQQKREVIESDQ